MMKKVCLSLCALMCALSVANAQSKPDKIPRAKSRTKHNDSARRIVKTDKAPQAIGPYSQAVIAGDLVFASGQIPFDPKTGKMVEGAIAEQIEQALRNLFAVLEAAGVRPNQVVKTTVFLTDMNDFAAMNEVYGRYFKTNPPARSTIEVARLPRNARVEIEAIAVRK